MKVSRVHYLLFALGLIAGTLCLGGSAGAAAPADPHAMHHQMAMQTAAKHMTVEYAIPDLKLVRNDGKIVELPRELNDGRPVVLNFVYTSCTAICPITSQTFAMFQERLGKERDKVHLVSISIDPEEDTPARLTAYAEKFGAGPEWQHYTGTAEASLAAQRAFDVYRGDKMNHVPVTLLRAAPGKPWMRLEGFVTADRLMDEYHSLMAGS
jgi:protein SCO1/2